MASINPITVPTKRLASSIDASAGTFQLNDILGWDGAALTSSDFGTVAYGVFRNDTNTIIELFEFDPTTIASTNITINKRGLKFTGDLTTEVTANKKTWVKNETFVEIGSNPPQLLQHFVDTISDETVAGIKTFSSIPVLPSSNPTANDEAARKAYVDSVAGGSALYDQNLVSALAGETVAEGESVYLKEADGEWYLTDASASATSEVVIVGIAQGAGTDGNTISGGVLIGGIDKTATYTAGSKYFLTDVAGALGTSAGTVEVLVGTGDANNNLVFEHIVTNESLTAAQKDAAVGNNTDIAVGSGNKYVTQTGLQDGAEIYAADGEASDTYVITLSPVPAALQTGQVFHFKANTANTGACTLNVNSLGAIDIKKLHDQDPVTGDIESGQIVTVIYDGTNFQMQSQVAISSGTDVQTFTSSGTYTKPSGAIKVLVQVWGAGGSGAKSQSGGNGTGGGGGGEYVEFIFEAGDIGATETITINSGGALVSATDTNGNSGGTSTFGSLLTAVGGGGGITGTPANDGTGGVGGQSYGTVDGIYGSGGVEATGVAGTHSAGGGGATVSSTGFAGGASRIGGGGGGGSSDSDGAGGVSLLGGNGGAGNNAGNGVSGTAPGGGGGGTKSNNNSGAGADGQIIVTTYK